MPERWPDAMTIVAGVDFGTASVRVSIMDSERGRLGFGTAPYPVLRRRDDADFATQRHEDHCRALEAAFAGRAGRCQHEWRGYRRAGHRHHRLHRGAGGREAAAAGRLLSVVRSPRLARSGRDHGQGTGTKAGGAGLVGRRLFLRMGLCQAAALAARQSGTARPLSYRRRTLRPDGRRRLCGITDPAADAALRLRHGPQMDVERLRWAACRRDAFLSSVDPLLAGVRARLDGRYRHIGRHRRRACRTEWARASGPAKPAFPFPWVRWTRIGMPSAPVASWAMWSM